MQTDASGLRAVKIECLDGFSDIGPKLVPRVALGEDTLGQALGTKTVIGLLSYLEHDFVHNFE